MEKKEFWVGCNYWASNAGCLMWRRWDENAVRSDMKRMAEAGMNCLRVFANWEDFQPVIPVYGGGGSLKRYAMADESRPTNPWYLDEVMMARFETFCDIALENGISLIVGPLTGWMSGRLFVPPVLRGRNLFTDPVALLFEQKYLQGFVTRMRHHQAITAWDHGNECGCLSPVESREVMQSWTIMMTNAIRAADPNRPVITGIHDLSLAGSLRIGDQGECVDMLVTHPYPFWVRHCGGHPILSMKTLLHASAQTALYADVSGKPCLVEEIGTMGPMICSEEAASPFLRLNMLLAYLYNRPGMLWWNGFDQNFGDSPYLENACERELGMFTQDGRAKAFTNEMTATARRLKTLPPLSGYHVDAVCILGENQDPWKIAYATFLLAVQAGLTIAFADGAQPLPEADAYTLPNVGGLDKDRYDDLKRRVRAGAKLYLSMGSGILTEFEEVTGLRIEDSAGAFLCSFELDGKTMSGRGQRQLIYRGEPNGLHRHPYGAGVVYTLDFSPEDCLFDLENPEQSDFYRIYRHIFREEIQAHPIDPADPEVGVIWHPRDGICGIVNYSGETKVVAGHEIKPYDAILTEI